MSQQPLRQTGETQKNNPPQKMTKDAATDTSMNIKSGTDVGVSTDKTSEIQGVGGKDQGFHAPSDPTLGTSTAENRTKSGLSASQPGTGFGEEAQFQNIDRAELTTHEPRNYMKPGLNTGSVKPSQGLQNPGISGVQGRKFSDLMDS